MTEHTRTLQQIHWKTLLRQRGEALVYDTGTSQHPFIGVLTRPGENQTVSDAVSFELKQWDVLLSPGDVVDLAGQPIVPVLGHSVMRVADGQRFDVQPSSTSGNCFRWSDTLKTWRRIHLVATREI